MPSLPEAADRSAGQLTAAWLDAVEFEADPEWNAESRVVRYHLEYEHAVSIGEGENASKGIVGLTIRVGWRDEEDNELSAPHPFRLELRVAGAFDWQREMVDRDMFEAWLEWNGPYLLWPYARSYITTITSASPVPALTIYTLRVPDPPPPKAVQGVEEIVEREHADENTTASAAPDSAEGTQLS